MAEPKAEGKTSDALSRAYSHLPRSTSPFPPSFLAPLPPSSLHSYSGSTQLTTGNYTTEDVPGLANALESSHMNEGQWVLGNLNQKVLGSRDDSNTLYIAYVLAVEHLRVHHRLARPPGLPSDFVVRALRRRLEPQAQLHEGDARCTACREEGRKSVHAWIGCWAVDGACAACIVRRRTGCRFGDTDEEEDGDGRPRARRKTNHVSDDTERATVSKSSSAVASSASPESEPSTPEQPVLDQVDRLLLEPSEPKLAAGVESQRASTNKPKLSPAAAALVSQLVLEWTGIYGSLTTIHTNNPTLTARLLNKVTNFRESAKALGQREDVNPVHSMCIWKSFMLMDCLLDHAIRLQDATIIEEVLDHAAGVHEGVRRLAVTSGLEGMVQPA